MPNNSTPCANSERQSQIKIINSPLNAVFSGPEGGSAEVCVSPTPGKTDKRVAITLNEKSAVKAAAISSERLLYGDYDAEPDGYEHDAAFSFSQAVPELMHALAYAQTVNPMQVEVRGFSNVGSFPTTPVDGVVVQNDVRRHVFNLVGAFAGGWGLKGFCYSSENSQKLLRAVAPVAQNAGQASSQGFAADLGWHGDNANRAIVGVKDTHPGGRGPMNPFQAFVNIRPDAMTPMETVALEDAVSQASHEHGTAVIDQLQKAEYAIDKPDSHGGGRDIENVPLLIRHDDGRLHGRFHAGNCTGLNPTAQKAFEAFKATLRNLNAVMEVEGEAYALFKYSNSRALHRRRQYEPKLDGTDRYYIRLYLIGAKHFADHAKHADGRIFT